MRTRAPAARHATRLTVFARSFWSTVQFAEVRLGASLAKPSCGDFSNPEPLSDHGPSGPLPRDPRFANCKVHNRALAAAFQQHFPRFIANRNPPRHEPRLQH